MSRYRWLKPSKCIEEMEGFSALKGTEYQALQDLLFDAVSRGDVRVLLNDVVVPKAHIGIYLSLFLRSSPEPQLREIPTDLTLSYDDLCAVYDRPMIDNRKRGRPAKEHTVWSEDRQAAYKMHLMLSKGEANSAAEAARKIVAMGLVSGGGMPESKAKRLVRAFRKYYSS